MEDTMIVLTWNCAHLANANKFEHIRHVNTMLGLHVPMLTTPIELIMEKEEGQPMERKDLAIAEIRKARVLISEQFGNDTRKIVAHYKELEAKYAGRIVRPGSPHAVPMKRPA